MGLTTTFEMRNSIAAHFPSVEASRGAVEALEAAGFKDVWVGMIKEVEAQDGETVGETGRADLIAESTSWFERLFGQGKKTLHDVLFERGVGEDRIAEIGELEGQSVLLTVDSENALDDAARIVRENGGSLLSSGHDDTPDLHAVANAEAPHARKAIDPDLLRASSGAPSMREEAPRRSDSEPTRPRSPDAPGA